jgi:outer membrane protein OmpA-like peptidoglycan-associated protein
MPVINAVFAKSLSSLASPIAEVYVDISPGGPKSLHNDCSPRKPVGDPLKLMIFLPAICATAALSSWATARGSATEPGPVAPADTVGTAEPRPPRTTPPSKQETALRTSLAQTAAVVSRSETALELWYPARLAFVPDGTELVAPAMAMLDLLARWLREFQHSNVVVTVYTDSIGASNYNQEQSQTRADTVMAYLQDKGISPARLVARGAGESAPLEAPNTPEGRDLNRRLQVVITPLSWQ